MQVKVTCTNRQNQLLITTPTPLPSLQPGDSIEFGQSQAIVDQQMPGGIRLKLPNGRFKLPGRWPMHLEKSEDAYILGPVIGIFSTRAGRTRGKPSTGSLKTFRRLIVDTRKMGAVAFVFAPGGIDWKRRIIHGLTYIPRTARSNRGTWVKGTFPFPHVVYNRVPTRKSENRPAVDRVRKRFMTRTNIHFFNPRFLDKWQVHNVLVDSEAAKPYLPSMAKLGNGSELNDFLQKHRTVYLKQYDGSLGNGTIRLDLVGPRRIMWRQTRGRNGIRKRRFSRANSLYRAIRALPQRRKYIMQAGIRLLKTEGRAFDIRALVQKEIAPNGKEKWHVTGMAVRIAGRGQITTHRPRGGSRGQLAPTLKTVFSPARAQEIENNLKRAIEICATSFDQLTGKTHGELSLDVGLDQRGHPWVLEINAKPMVFDEPSIRSEARQRLLRYCFHRAGFQTG